MSKNTKQFVMDIMEIRRRARQNMNEGAMTKSYGSDRDTIVRLLNAALATEIVCVLRYRRHYYMSRGINSEPVAQEFLEHSNEEQARADQIALRIAQLGGESDLDPKGLTARSHAEYAPGRDLKDMICEDFIA